MILSAWSSKSEVQTLRQLLINDQILTGFFTEATICFYGPSKTIEKLRVGVWWCDAPGSSDWHISLTPPRSCWSFSWGDYSTSLFSWQRECCLIPAETNTSSSRAPLRVSDKLSSRNKPVELISRARDGWRPAAAGSQVCSLLSRHMSRLTMLPPPSCSPLAGGVLLSQCLHRSSFSTHRSSSSSSTLLHPEAAAGAQTEESWIIQQIQWPFSAAGTSAGLWAAVSIFRWTKMKDSCWQQNDAAEK